MSRIHKTTTRLERFSSHIKWLLEALVIIRDPQIWRKNQENNLLFSTPIFSTIELWKSEPNPWKRSDIGTGTARYSTKILIYDDATEFFQALLERNIPVYTADEIISSYLPQRDIDIEIPPPIK